MDEQYDLTGLPEALLPWYQKNRRELPWRRDKDPYHIWVSEIMLQQTRVEAVKGYYARFLNVLPTVASLAECDDNVLQKLWEGLGYYTRVRNLKKAAQQIMSCHNGVFPREYEKVIALPGIGEYTAGAICSIAFDMPTPAVDGNVLRVITRITDDATPIDSPLLKRSVQQRLVKIYPAQAGAFTQALMELGATVCGPNRAPECDKCPCKDFCLGYKHGTAESLPVKTPKAPRKIEELTVFVLFCDGRFAVQKRPGKGLLAGLWQFPNVPGKFSGQDAVEKVEQIGIKPKDILLQVERKHIFTHIEWRMNGIYMETAEENDRFCWMTADQIRQQVALPTAFKLFWDEMDTAENSKIFQKKTEKVFDKMDI